MLIFNIPRISRMMMILLVFTSIGYAQNLGEVGSFQQKEKRAPERNFTGTVWVTMNVEPKDDYNLVTGTVTFEPRARINWHTHDTGQILYITSGTGAVQNDQNPILIVHKGDVVKIPKNTRHWHGATPYLSMTHIAIVPDLDRGRTNWLKPVTDKTYYATQNYEK